VHKESIKGYQKCEIFILVAGYNRPNKIPILYTKVSQQHCNIHPDICFKVHVAHTSQMVHTRPPSCHHWHFSIFTQWHQGREQISVKYLSPEGGRLFHVCASFK